MPGLGVIGHAHFLHRAWRYRLRTERAEIGYLRSLDLQGRTAVDIGAHRGIFSYWMAKAVGPSGRLLAFEPQPEMIRQHRDFQRSFFWLRNITLVESGLSDTAGTATMSKVGNHTGGASLARQNTDGATTFSVPVTTLDEYLESNPCGPVAFIKCDVEGFEREVFRGAVRTIARDRPAILFECHDKQARQGDVFRDLQALGYRGWFLVRGQRVPVEQWAAERQRVDKPYLNYIFEPSESSR
jgi:FkbM family methyltransferase